MNELLASTAPETALFFPLAARSAWHAVGVMSGKKPSTEAAQLHAAALRTAALDLRPFEEGAASEAAGILLPATLAAVDEALSICRTLLASHPEPEDEVSSWCDEPGEDTGVFLRRIDTLADRGPSVGDLAFMGVTALLPKRAALEDLNSSSDAWFIVSECGSTRRRVLKTLTALEGGLAEEEERPRALTFASELGRSLETRRQYSRLRHSILREAVSPGRARPVLRRIGTTLAILVGQDIYPDLRISDRRQLRRLQSRILDWLRAGEVPDSARSADRLYGDLVVFAQLLAQVRLRMELVEHDRAALCQLRAKTAGTPLASLRSLRGLDDELDGLLEHDRLDQDDWLPVIRRLCASFGVNESCQPTG